MDRDKIVAREKEGEGVEEGSKSAVLQKDLPTKIKEEPRDEILKDYAENTMNELLGLYGYDKVINSSDTENLNLDRYTSTSTPLEGRFSLTDDEARDDVSLDSCDSSSGKSDQSKYGRSRSNSESNLAAQHRNLVTALTKKHGLTGVPEGTLPFGYVVCAWCQKPGGKNFTLKTEEKKTKTFCSEVCFTQCRRASFKKNKICDWCKHVRHTVNYVDFQDGETQLQFCSSKCLNQYKMNIFCKETQEHLQQIQSPGESSRDTISPSKILITPDLWLKNGRTEKRELEDEEDEKVNSKFSKKEKERDVPKVELDNHESSSVLEGERIPTINRKVMNHTHRERSRKSLRRDSPSRPTSQNSEVRAVPSPCPPNTNMAALNSWLSPHMWGTFGMAPMGALPPWYYPGLLPPGMPTGLLPPPVEHMPAQQDHHRLNVSPSNRTNSSMEYDSDSSSGTISAHRKSPRNIGSTNLKRSSRSSETPNHLPVNPFPPQLPPVPIAHQNGSPRPYNPASLMPPGASNIPPMTMIMPVPVPVPMPVPIPLPLPITMEKIMEVFDKNNVKKEPTVVEGAIKTKIDCNGMDSKHPFNGRDVKNDINENDMSRDRLSCVSCSSDRSGSVGSCPEFSSTHSDVPTPSDLSSYYRKRDMQQVKDERSDFRKNYRHEDTYSDSCEEAIDLSRNSVDKTRVDDVRLNGAEKLDESVSSAEDEGGIKVPKIHIISPRSEPPLSQQLPLPPIDPKFAARRGLILDAPGVQKRQRSPSPDRRSYARTVPRDVMEAARRRCLRARIRTK